MYLNVKILCKFSKVALAHKATRKLYKKIYRKSVVENINTGHLQTENYRKSVFGNKPHDNSIYTFNHKCNHL